MEYLCSGESIGYSQDILDLENFLGRMHFRDSTAGQVFCHNDQSLVMSGQ